MARFTIIIAFATLQLAAGLAECSSLAGAFSILSKKGAACKVCGNYCGPAWCADANLAEGPACADATANWDTVKATDPTDSCCQAHDKCCGSPDTWKVTGSNSCNQKLKACATDAVSTTSSSDPCGGDAFNDELDILGSMGDQCCGESKGDTYAGATCGSTTSPPTPAPKCNQKTTDKCTFYCNIGWWHPEGCEGGVCTCSDGYCAKGADCVSASSVASSAKLQMSADGGERYRSSSGTAGGAIVGGVVGVIAAVGAVVGLYLRRTATQEESVSYELSGADAQALYSEL